MLFLLTRPTGANHMQAAKVMVGFALQYGDWEQEQE